MDNQKLYPIKVVSRLTSLSVHVIRVWEKRYKAIVPARTETNRRLYTEQDIMKLKLLQKLTSFGYNIGQIGNFTLAQLQELVDLDISKENSTSVTSLDENQNHSLMKEAMTAIRLLDSDKLEEILLRAVVQIGQNRILEKLITPILEELGQQWQEGHIRAYHEHLATAVIRKFLTDQIAKVSITPHAPSIIVTTPLGQLHELGALIASFVATHQGWQVVYLGVNLPAEDIAAAALEKNIKYVLLSIVYPADDPKLHAEIIQLSEYLQEKTKLIIGGRAAKSYQQAISDTNSHYFSDLDQLRQFLQSLQK
jgi:DNA-binding transcriptional MerR regulator/methylmalonyl-CoA mutase cobalamin-binding subunit